MKIQLVGGKAYDVVGSMNPTVNMPVKWKGINSNGERAATVVSLNERIFDEFDNILHVVRIRGAQSANSDSGASCMCVR